LKSVHRILASSTETIGAFNTGFDSFNLYCPTVAAGASHTATAEEIAMPFEGDSTVPKEQSMASKEREPDPPASPLRLATHELAAALSRGVVAQVEIESEVRNQLIIP